jgi:Fe-S-cluster containining protein
MINKCQRCGTCCRLFFINLSEEEYQSGQYETYFKKIGNIENYSEAKKCGANILAKNKDGSCIYLKNKKCSIYSYWPRVCRNFFCSSKNKKWDKMIMMVKEAKRKNYFPR